MKNNSENSNFIGLKGFPHREEVHKRYFLHKPGDVSKTITNPKYLCCGSHIKGRPIFAVFKFFAAFCAVAALVVSLVKDFFGKESSLALALVELILALIAVSTTLLKHGFSWTHVRQKIAKLEDAHPDELQGTKFTIKRPGAFSILVIGVWLICCCILVVGFLVFHLLDKSEHMFLQYTKFSTALTVFISWILDSIVTDALQTLNTNFTIDQCMLLIHGMKEELYHELQKGGRVSRIDEIEKYLRSESTFNIEGHERIMAKGGKQETEQATDICDDEQIEQCEDNAENELIAIVKQIDNTVGIKLPKVEFKDKTQEKHELTELSSSLSSKKGMYESNEAFVVVEMDEVEGKQLLDENEDA